MAAIPPASIPPKTPVSTFVLIPRIKTKAAMVACMTYWAMIAAKAATPSFLVKPSATPTAKIKGMISNIAPQDSFIKRDKEFGSQEKSAAPIPSNIPAMGNTDTLADDDEANDLSRIDDPFLRVDVFESDGVDLKKSHFLTEAIKPEAEK